jgi:metal-responsive CopG/Arc/MetJ family transcriptional regulator
MYEAIVNELASSGEWGGSMLSERKPMESISLKLPQDLLETSGRCAKALGISRTEYIRRALERMNREAEARGRAERMALASRKVRRESMRVNAEFAAIESDPRGARPD